MSTLDNSVADIEDGVVEIKSSYGDVYCGGSDIDNVVAKHVVEEFENNEGVEISSDAAAMTRVLEAVEQAKIELSNVTAAEINLPYITVKDSQPIHLITTLHRSTFEHLISPIVKKVIDCGSEALRRANIAANELDGILLIGGSCRIPMVQKELVKAFGDKLILSSNFDLAVAEGAAIQANTLTGGENAEDILLLDVTPISIGIETMGGVFTKLVESNTTIPYKKTQVFTTAADNQPSVEIRVLQGERPMAADNKLIGAFKLDGILPAMRGVPQIEVTFDIDANGILNVSAKDKGTGKEQSVKIESKNQLSEEEIERIKKEAEEYSEMDKKRKEEADTINEGDALAFNTKKGLDELGDKITEDEKKTILEANTKLEEAVKNRNIEDIKKYSEETTKAFSEYYKRVNPSQQGTTNGGAQQMNADMFNQMFMNGNNQNK